MTYGHLQADCLYTGISSGPNARYRVWEAFTFYILVVFMAHIYTVRVHFDTRTYDPCIRAVCTGSAYRSSVYTDRTGELFDSRAYGMRVSKMHPYIRAVNTARIYRPYLRVVRIGLKGHVYKKGDGSTPEIQHNISSPPFIG